MQLSFIPRLPCPGGRLLFVGDPKQAIYGFAGADTRAMSRIVERTQATVLPLSVTYQVPAEARAARTVVCTSLFRLRRESSKEG